MDTLHKEDNDDDDNDYDNNNNNHGTKLVKFLIWSRKVLVTMIL
jgi:hypothetical protein